MSNLAACDRVHELKTWPVYFDAVKRGEKRFEIRENDRAFQRGDIVRLIRTRELDVHTKDTDLNGRPKHVLEFRIGWMATGGRFGIAPGTVVFSLDPLVPLSAPPEPQEAPAERRCVETPGKSRATGMTWGLPGTDYRHVCSACGGEWWQSQGTPLCPGAYAADQQAIYNRTPGLGAPTAASPLGETLRKMSDAYVAAGGETLSLDQINARIRDVRGGAPAAEKPRIVKAAQCYEPEESKGRCIHVFPHDYRDGPCDRHGCQPVEAAAGTEPRNAGAHNCPVEQPIPCPYGKHLIFVRANGSIVPHWHENGNRCSGNDRKYCDCHLKDRQVCDICQDRKQPKPAPKPEPEGDGISKIRCAKCSKALATVSLYIQAKSDIRVYCSGCEVTPDALPVVTRERLLKALDKWSEDLAFGVVDRFAASLGIRVEE